MSVFSPGVSSHGPRWASSRAQHRHCCCIQPLSCKEKGVEGSHTCAAKGAQRYQCAVQQIPGLINGAEIVYFLVILHHSCLYPALSPAWRYFPHILLCLPIYPTSLPGTPTRHRAQTFSVVSWSVLTPFPPPSPVYQFLSNATPTCFQGIVLSPACL